MRGYSADAGAPQGARASTFDADGFYHTGDAGSFDARGLLYFNGRLGELIKTGGANVTPSEVEAVLVAAPRSAAAYVVGVADAERGENVAAAVVLEPGARSTPTRSARRARELAAYKVPRHVLVAAQDSAALHRQRQDRQAPPARAARGANHAELQRRRDGSAVSTRRRALVSISASRSMPKYSSSRWWAPALSSTVARAAAAA